MLTTVELQYPITIDEVEISEVNLRRPKVRDIKTMETKKDDMAKSIFLISALGELTTKQVEELDGEDFQTLADEVGKMMGVD